MRSSSTSRPRRIAEAIRRRAALAERGDLTAYRVFHGDAEGAPGLAVDRFDDVAVIHVDSPDVFTSWESNLRNDLADFATAYVKVHPREASRLAPSEVARLAPVAPLWGSAVDGVHILEGGVRYEVR